MQAGGIGLQAGGIGVQVGGIGVQAGGIGMQVQLRRIAGGTAQGCRLGCRLGCRRLQAWLRGVTHGLAKVDLGVVVQTCSNQV